MVVCKTFKRLITQERLLITGTIIFFVGLITFTKYSIHFLSENGIKTVGIISETGGKNITVTYTFADQPTNTVVGQPYYTLEDGEEFYIKVDPQDYKNILVEFWNPVFDKNDFVKTSSIKVNALWSSDNIEFHYLANNKEYKRFQRLSPGIKDEYIQETNPYVVYYKKENPKIAYLLLE